MRGVRVAARPAQHHAPPGERERVCVRVLAGLRARGRSLPAHRVRFFFFENEVFDIETAEQIWHMPVVQLWADILALFEGKGRSGSSSFWCMMCTAVKFVNPKIKGHPVDFAVARNDLQQAWHGLLKMYQDENKPLEALIDRLQAEQHLEMMRLMAAHPQEGTTWEDAYKKCVSRQGVVGGGLTLDVTEKSPRRP